MKKWAWALALVCSSAWAPGQAQSGTSAPKTTPDPFYRKYLVAGDPLDDKIIEQERRIDASPNDANLRNDFGNLLAKRRFPKEAAQQYQIALKLDPKGFIAAYNLGLLYETEGKVSSAISAYKTSIARKPGFPQAHFRLGRLYEHTNQSEAAVSEYAKAFWIDPAMREAKRNPLVIDSELIYRASLANYQRDVAVASMVNESVYFEESRFRKLPVDRAISAQEAAAAESEVLPGPRDVAAPGTMGSTGAPDSGPRRAPRPAGTTEAPASILGGRPRPTPGPRSNMTHTVPAQPVVAPAQEPPAPAAPPESLPEPTPTPGPPPSEDEPS